MAHERLLPSAGSVEIEAKLLPRILRPLALMRMVVVRPSAAAVSRSDHQAVRLTAKGRDTYAAKAGAHDDLVLAVALAVWAAECAGIARTRAVVSAGG